MSASRDPRLLNKRPASRSPDDSISTHKRSNVPPSRLSSSVSASAASDSPLTAPVANMGSSINGAAAAASHDPFEDLLEISISTSTLRIKLEHAQQELDRALREHKNLADKFSAFPAIKEQKTSAKARAQKKVDELTASVQQQQQKHSHVLLAIRSEFVSREEHNQVNDVAVGRVTSMQKTLSSVESKVTGLETKLGSLDSRLSALEKIPSTPVSTTTSPVNPEALKELIERVDDLEQGDTDLITSVEKAVEEKLQANQKQALMDVQTVKDQLLAAVSQAVTNLETRIQKYEDEKALADKEAAAKKARDPYAGEEPGLLKFRPCLPDPDTSDELKGFDKLFNEIDMLKSVTLGHTRQINNLTTDEVVRCMVDQMSIMYPEAKSFQKTTTVIHGNLNILAQRIQKLETDSSQLTGGDVKQFTQRLAGFDKAIADWHTAYQTLSSKVDQNAKNLEQSQKDL